jgi:hypothetical protein
MINPFADIRWNPDIAERKKFGQSLMIGFPVIAIVLGTVNRIASGAWHGGFLWLAVIGFAAGLVFFLLPQFAKPFYLVWYVLAACIGVVISNIALGAFYYLMIAPVGLIMRLSGRDPLRRRTSSEATSYWRDVEKAVDPKRYFRQF